MYKGVSRAQGHPQVNKMWVLSPGSWRSSPVKPDANTSENRENVIEECDSAIQSMLWRHLHGLALLSVGVQSIGSLPCGGVMQFTNGSGLK